MKILSDLHHSSLYASLHYLLEDRLEHDLYRPIGMDWFTEGYWKIAEPYGNNEATVRQYLDENNIPPDGSNPLNDIKQTTTDGIHYIKDSAHGYYQSAITLAKFKEMDFDVVIASIPAHIIAYRELIKNTNSKAKLVYQMGNIGWQDSVPWGLIDNVMASVKPFQTPADKNVVFYRQEFNTRLFKPSDTVPEQLITSFVNCLPEPDRFSNMAKSTPTMKFESYGISCSNGICQTVVEIANRMQRSMYGYHFKPGGDGYGHVIHNWMAVGKPILVGLDDYRDKLAGELLEDKVTCIDMSHRNSEQVADIMAGCDYATMCSNVKERFAQTVDFEKDAVNVRGFIDGLL